MNTIKMLVHERQLIEEVYGQCYKLEYNPQGFYTIQKLRELHMPEEVRKDYQLLTFRLCQVLNNTQCLPCL